MSILLFFSLNTSAQGDQESMMKAWTAYMTPGEMHKMLADASGDWVTDVKMWMEPNSQPITSKGACTNKMILGGRYQESQFSGDFMNQKMEGIGHMAYDNAKKQFESTWLDNMGTGIMKTSGTYDPATKTLTMTGTQVDPMTGKDCAIRETLKFIDRDNHVMEMYTTPNGAQEFKTMEIKFVRKK
jgi:hypothetical protein